MGSRIRQAHGPCHVYNLTLPAVGTGSTANIEIGPKLHMLGPLVLNGVGGQINGIDIVTVHNGGSPKRAMELMEELTQPTRLHNSICDNAILDLCTGSRDCRLTLGRPRNQIITQKYTVSRSGMVSIGTTGPISISVHSEISSRGAKKVKTEVQGTLNVAQNALSWRRGVALSDHAYENRPAELRRRDQDA